MSKLVINFHERDTLPNQLEQMAQELEITAEQLVLRFICERMSDYEMDRGPAEPGRNIDDFLVKNGALKKR